MPPSWDCPNQPIFQFRELFILPFGFAPRTTELIHSSRPSTMPGLSILPSVADWKTLKVRRLARRPSGLCHIAGETRICVASSETLSGFVRVASTFVAEA